ncbi:MAG: OmpA family protein [Brevinematales bacterium]|nr:OmpA family protein [Brevinematales bacterium]
MKWIRWVGVVVAGCMYADHQIVAFQGIKAGLYDDTAFGLSFSVDGVGTFLKANRPPTTLVMMSIDGKVIPVGSAVGFFHQRPLLTNGGVFTSWEARGLKWDIFLSPMRKEGVGEGVLVSLIITNVEKRSTSFGVQVLFDVVSPFGEPVVVTYGGTKITQENVFQGRSLVTQWAVYSQLTNLSGFVVIAQSPLWQRVAFAEWKRFYDYPGEAPIKKDPLFKLLPATGASVFYPVQKLEAGDSQRITYWMGISSPPEGVVKTVPVPKPAPQKEEVSPIQEAPVAVVTNQPMDAVLPPPPLTNQEVPQKIVEKSEQHRAEWRVVIDRFEFASSRLLDSQRQALETWFLSLEERESLFFEVVGHADEVGSLRVNYTMGKQRAEAVAAWLKTQGVPSHRIQVFSRGETEPRSQKREENRRVEIVARRKK